jgi:hypothetical protein
LIAIDFEASGLGPGSFPIEVALAPVDGELPWSALIRPTEMWCQGEWDEIAEEVHGISLEQIVRQGLDVTEVIERLASASHDAVLVSDGAIMDTYWLSRLWDEVFPRPLMPEIVALSSVVSDTALLDGFDHLSRKHRALSDAVLLRDFLASSSKPCR